MCYKTSLYFLTFLSFLVTKAVCVDEYVKETQETCTKTRDFYSCAKLRVLKTISNYAVPIEDASNSSSLLKLVRITDSDEEENAVSEEVLPSARYFTKDNEFNKFLKFVQRQVNYILTHQGLKIPLPDGARLIDWDEDVGRGTLIFCLLINKWKSIKTNFKFEIGARKLRG